MNKLNRKAKTPLPCCPSCGMDSGRRMADERGRYYVICESCGAYSGPYLNQGNATRMWGLGVVKRGKKRVSGV